MPSRFKSNSDYIRAINSIQKIYNTEFPETISKHRIKFILDAFLKEIQSSLSSGQEFNIYTFGKFYTKFYEGKAANNPVGKGVEWESRHVPGFIPAPEFKETIKNKVKAENK